jgi:hypothetical protein
MWQQLSEQPEVEGNASLTGRLSEKSNLHLLSEDSSLNETSRSLRANYWMRVVSASVGSRNSLFPSQGVSFLTFDYPGLEEIFLFKK